MPLTFFWGLPRNRMGDAFNDLVERRLARRTDPPAEPYAFAAALFYYNSQAPYRLIPQALKYRGAVAAGRYFARRLGRRLAGSDLYRDVDLVVPVPLHWTRHRQRGYNQAAVIAREVAAEMGVPMDARLLRRRRRTRTQTRMTVEQKTANVGGAFAVRPPHLARVQAAGVRHVLLVDDVFTTGATLEACHAALRAAGLGPDRCRISIATLGYVGRL